MGLADDSEVVFDDDSDVNSPGCGLPPDGVAAQTLWGEARGEGKDGIEAVASVIYRRAMRRMAEREEPWGIAVSKVCLAEGQFSCWKDGLFVQPEPTDCPAWSQCDWTARILLAEDFEPTIVATNYHADEMDPPPPWASRMRLVGMVGNQLFYKEW